MTNDAILQAMKAHHASLVTGLQHRVDALAVEVAARRPHGPAAAEVADFLEAEIYPHALAEEDAIYPLATTRDHLGALVAAMIEEHGHLRRQAGALRGEPDGARAVGRAQAAATVFGLHADKENDFILPVLAADPGVELENVLARMHALLGGEEGPSPTDADAASSGAPSVLDVRSLPPARRHELIFATFDALEAGQSFELVNDHDPKPLRYQLVAEHPDRFTWDYLESGPQAWRVRIGRTAA